MPNQTVRTKFSSIQGSSSPILCDCQRQIPVYHVSSLSPTKAWSCPPGAGHLARQAYQRSAHPGTGPGAVTGPSAGPSAAGPSADPFAAGSSAVPSAEGPSAGPWGFAAGRDRRSRRIRRAPAQAAAAARRPRQSWGSSYFRRSSGLERG
jgi:hypothetical protein